MRRALPLLLALAALPLAACGGTDDEPLVYAASSLKAVLPGLDAADGVAFSFAGSDSLARQIREGAPADALVAASPRYPDELAADGLCDAPVAFATNTLALIVPAADARVATLDDLLAGPELRLAVGAPEVPVGAYARAALAAAGADAALARNRVSDEPDAASIVAKVALGSADAGIAYATDAAASDDVRAVPLPAAAQPTVVYAACAVIRDGAPSPAGTAFVAALLGDDAQARLTAAGFGGAP
jgi:molybdate transport system substrate-binding protein